MSEKLSVPPDNENGYRVGGLCYATMVLGKYINGVIDDLMTTTYATTKKEVPDGAK